MPPVSPDSNRPFLLIADDEPTVLSVARAMARELGWKPLIANTGAHAVEVFRTHAARIGAVLIDQHMPQLTGAEAVSAIHALDPGARVILMTGDPDAPAVASAGVEAVLSKPFRLEDLERMLEFRPHAERPEAA